MFPLLYCFLSFVYFSFNYTKPSDILSRGVAISPQRTIEDLYKKRTPLYDKFCDIKIYCDSMAAEKVQTKLLNLYYRAVVQVDII